MDKDKPDQKTAEEISLKETLEEHLQEAEPLPAPSKDARHEGRISQTASGRILPEHDVGPEYQLIQKHVRFVSASWAVILAALALTMSVFCFSSVVAWPWQMSWPTVQGKVVEVSRFTKNTCRFTYEYPVAGQIIHGFADKPGSLNHTVKERDIVTIRYNPNRIVESCMQSGFNIIETPFYVVVSFFLFIAAWGFACGKYDQWQYKTFPLDELKKKKK